MEPNQDNGNRISRKSFLRICGSVIAGGSILGVTGTCYGRCLRGRMIFFMGWIKRVLP